MKPLYTIEMFHQTIDINSIEYNVFLQMYIKVGESTYTSILLLKSGQSGQIDVSDEFIFTSFNYQKLLHIPTNMINKIIKAVKLIPFKPELQNKINNLSYKCKPDNKEIQKVKIGNNFYVMAQHSSQIATSQNVQIEFLDNIRIKPSAFVFGAFDGINSILHLTFESKNYEFVRDWSFLAGLKLFIDNHFCGHYYPSKILFDAKDKLTFLCKTKASMIFESSKLGFFKSDGFDMYELINYVVSSAGLLDSVAYPDNYDKIQKWYTLIIAIDGLDIENNFGIGSVEYIKKSHKEAIRVIAYNNEFDKYNTFALVHINNENLYNAFTLGKKQIEQSIDLLINIYKDDNLYNIHSTGQILMNRDINVLQKKVHLSSCIYIESPLTNERLSSNFRDIDINYPLTVSTDFINSIKELYHAEMLLIKANGNNDKEISPLFNSLKWIRKAWDSSDLDDKIINSIIALEFIVSKEKDEPMMCRRLRKDCKKAISQTINQYDDQIIDINKYLEDVLSKFDRVYTQSPFMQKLRNLVTRLNIPVSEQEFDLIYKARDKRNKIIHGKQDIIIDKYDIYMLCEIISKIAIYKINSLEV